LQSQVIRKIRRPRGYADGILPESVSDSGSNKQNEKTSSPAASAWAPTNSIGEASGASVMKVTNPSTGLATNAIIEKMIAELRIG
jgi:hypothetical protein